MNKKRSNSGGRKEIRSHGSSAGMIGYKPWLLAVIAILSLGIGGVVVERLTRPKIPAPADSRPVLNTPPANYDALVPPRPVAPNVDEVVAEGKQLGTEIVEQFSDNPEALSLAGAVQFTFGNPDQALLDWQQAIELDPRSADAWLGLAKTAHKRGDFDRAVQYMRHLVDIAPDVAETQSFFLVDSLLNLGQPQEVVDLLEELGESAPLPGGARISLGQAYYQLQQYEQAAEQYRHVLDDPEQASVAHYGLSRVLMRLGQSEQAQHHREEYARLQQENMVVFDRMQGAKTDKERNDPKPLYPLLAGFHFETAKLYALRGQRAEAEEHAYRAWALTPDRPEPRLLLESFRAP